MTPSANTPLFPTSCEPLTPGAAVFSASAIYCDGTDGTVTFEPSGGGAPVTLGITKGATLPCLAIKVTAATATSLYRLF